MIKRLYITIIFLFGTSYIFAQPDCVILLRYKVTVKSDSVHVTALGLPTTAFLIGYIDKNEQRAFAIADVKDNKVDKVLMSHLSSDFCAVHDTIIRRVFKKPTQGYLIKIFEAPTDSLDTQKVREITIPIDSIKFSSEQIESRLGIVLDLGEIKL